MLLTLYVTRDCNLSCSYCFAGRKRRERMSRDLAERAVRLVADRSSLILGVRFFGGEPLLEWDLIKHITSFTRTLARERKLLPSFSISTNGTLLADEHLEFFEEHDIGVGISIDGLPSVHDRNRRTLTGRGSFHRARDGFLLARERDVRLSVELVVDPSTITELADSVRFLVEQLGVSFIIVSINVFADWSGHLAPVFRGQFRSLADFYLERFDADKPFEIDILNNKINVLLRGGYDMDRVCHFCMTEFTVVPDGRIYPCLRIVGSDEEGETTIGTVEHGLNLEAMAAMHAESRVKPSQCVACRNDGFCVNWCASSNFALTGRFNKVGDLLCAYEGTLIETCRDLMSRLDLSKYERMYGTYLVGCASKCETIDNLVSL